MRLLTLILIGLFTLFAPLLIAQTQIGSDIDGEAAGDLSGVSISSSSDGTIMAIGAHLNDGNGAHSGHVRVYQYSSGTWSQIGADIDGEAGYDYSARSISLNDDGTILAIGATLNSGNGVEAGHVRVYEYSSNTWSQLGADINGEAAYDWSGYAISLSSDGTILAIGAKRNDGNGSNSGHVRVYGYSSSTWSQLGADIDGEAADDNFGNSVSLNSAGTILAVGAEFNDGNGSQAGHVRVYEYSSSTLSQLGADIDGEAAYDWSGYAISLSSDGTILAIGARQNDGNGSQAGHVRVYGYSSSTWSQLGADIDGEAGGDFFGHSVSLNASGKFLAVGATHNDGNGNASGHVRVYGYSGSTWSQLGADIDGEAASDGSGESVSLSSDGSIVSIGAHLNDGNGSNSGHVRVYNTGILSIVNGGLSSNSSDQLTITTTANNQGALQDAGDQISFIVGSESFAETSSDLPTSNLSARYQKTWDILVNDVNDNGGELTMSFNLGSAINPQYTYYLLGRNGSSGNFSEIAINAYKIHNQKVEFTVDLSNITDGWSYTLGRSEPKAGYCLNFDGSNDYVDLGDVDESSGKISIEMWVKFDNSSSNHTLFTKSNFSNGQSDDPYAAYYDGVNDFLYWYANGYYWSKTWVPNNNQWYHLGFTYENGSYNLYIDGVRVYKDQAMNRGALVNTTNSLLLGTWVSNSNKVSYFDGEMDEVRIWSDIRTFEEIRANMHRPLSGFEPNLMAYLRMDRSVGAKAPDLSINSNEGTLNQFALTGSSSNWVESTCPIGDSTINKIIIGPGNALHFDGSNDYVDCNDVLDMTTAFTISAWVKPDAINTSLKFIASKFNWSSGTGSDDSYAFYVYNGILRILLSNGSTHEIKSSALQNYSVGSWSHLAATYDGSSVKLYEDGLLIGTHTTAFTSINNSATDFNIGCLLNNSSVSNHFDGQIDELRVWNVTKSQTDIQDNMYAALDGNETGLAAYFTFDELSGTSLNDMSSNSNNGTLKNFSGTYFVNASGREPYKTILSGSHNSGSTWKGGTAPSTSTDKLAVFHDLTIAATGTYDRLQVNSSKTLTINSDLTVNGDVIVNGTCAGSNKIILGGSAKQCLGGSGTLHDLQVNNSNDVSLEGDLTIGGALTLTSGDIEVNGHTLTLGGTTSHGSTNSYLKINGDGRVKTTVGSTPVILPIGRNPYLPVIIDDGGGAEFTLGVSDNVYDNPQTQTGAKTTNVVSETWTIQANQTANNVIVQIGWDAAEEETGFDRSLSMIGYWENGVSTSWNTGDANEAATGSDPYYRDRTINFTTNLYYLGVGSNGSALPVELTHFSAQWQELGKSTLLQWQTAMEENNSHFEVERKFSTLSGVEGSWETIGRVEGAGNSMASVDYHFIDQLETPNQKPETIYYRLKQVDYDGNFEYSEVRTLNFKPETRNSISVYPNPATSIINVQSVAPVKQIEIYNLHGQLIKKVQNTSSLQVGDLPEGQYLLRIDDGQSITQHKILVS